MKQLFLALIGCYLWVIGTGQGGGCALWLAKGWGLQWNAELFSPLSVGEKPHQWKMSLSPNVILCQMTQNGIDLFFMFYRM